MRRGLTLVLLAGCGSYTPIDSHYNKGVEFYDQKRLPEAIQEYKLAVDDDPKNYRAHFNLAVCYHDDGKIEEALREYERVLELHPQNARAMVNVASIRGSEGKESEALALLEKAVQVDPDSGFPRSSLGAYYERKGDLDRALAEYRASVKIEPGHVTGHYRIGLLLAKREDFRGAGAAFDAALASDPDDVATLVAASDAHERGGEAKAAMLLLERALVHVPDRGDHWLKLAGLYEVQGRLEDAVAALWEARATKAPAATVGPKLKALYEKLAAQER